MNITVIKKLEVIFNQTCLFQVSKDYFMHFTCNQVFMLFNILIICTLKYLINNDQKHHGCTVKNC